MSGWIDGAPNLDMLAGWCNVFQKSTENFIIGILINPIIANIEDILSPFEGSLKDLEKIINPI